GTLTYPISFVFFFFQAEDGIRDRNVTGVQTCALPISRPSSTHEPGRGAWAWPARPAAQRRAARPAGRAGDGPGPCSRGRGGRHRGRGKIGRASCRERV